MYTSIVHIILWKFLLIFSYFSINWETNLLYQLYLIFIVQFLTHFPNVDSIQQHFILATQLTLLLDDQPNLSHLHVYSKGTFSLTFVLQFNLCIGNMKILCNKHTANKDNSEIYFSVHCHVFSCLSYQPREDL